MIAKERYKFAGTGARCPVSVYSGRAPQQFTTVTPAAKLLETSRHSTVSELSVNAVNRVKSFVTFGGQIQPNNNRA